MMRSVNSVAAALALSFLVLVHVVSGCGGGAVKNETTYYIAPKMNTKSDALDTLFRACEDARIGNSFSNFSSETELYFLVFTSTETLQQVGSNRYIQTERGKVKVQFPYHRIRELRITDSVKNLRGANKAMLLFPAGWAAMATVHPIVLITLNDGEEISINFKNESSARLFCDALRKLAS